MDNSGKIREKIAALLKKTEANGASEAEAASAMTIAAKLMAEHGVTLNDLKEKNEASRDFMKKHVNEGSKTMSIIDKFVSVAIATYTDTKVWNQKEHDGYKMGKKRIKQKFAAHLMFYGYSVDVELANYIYKICDSAVETEWKKYAVKLPVGIRAKSRVTFQLGMALRLKERLLALKGANVEKTNGSELIILKKQLVETALKESANISLVAGNNAGVKYYKGNVFEEGKKAADNVRFNREVYDGPKGGMRMLAK